MDTKVYYGSAYNLEGVYDFDEYFQMIFLLEEGGEWLPCKVDMGRRRVLYVRKNVKLIIAKNNVIEIEPVVFPEKSEPYIKLSDVFKKKGIKCWTSNDTYKHIPSYCRPAWKEALNERGAYFSNNGFAIQEKSNWGEWRSTYTFNMIILKKNWIKIGDEDISNIRYCGKEDAMYKGEKLIEKALGRSYDISKEKFVEQVKNCGFDAEQIELYERDPRYEGTDKCWWCLS